MVPVVRATRPSDRLVSAKLSAQSVSEDRMCGTGVPVKRQWDRLHLDISAVQAMRPYIKKRGTVCTSLQALVVAI